MKLITFRPDSGEPTFGLVLDNGVIAFDDIVAAMDADPFPYRDCLSYVQNLPASENLARQCQDYALEHRDTLNLHEITSVKILPPLYPPAMLDFGLTPKHLLASAATLLKHEYGPLMRRVLGAVFKRRIAKVATEADLPYYKCNHTAIIGDGDEPIWPSYSAYLDIEPELGIVTGTAERRIAGYLIFNDFSARDVQMPEMIGLGPARSKDFSRGNGLGPFLVTPDEVPNPLDLAVTVKIAERLTWQGTTAEYVRTPQQVIDYVHTIFTPPPGTVLGMGTIPGCAGLDNDVWIRPGDTVAITFDRLGTLHQGIPAEVVLPQNPRWEPRTDF